MIQQTYKVHSPQEVLELAKKIQASKEYKTAQSILISGLTLKFPDEGIRDSHEMFNRMLPRAKIVGMSLTAFAQRHDKHKRDERYGIISVLYFFKSNVDVLEIGGAKLEYGDPSLMLKDKLLRIKDIKAVEVLCAGKSRYMSSFMETITEGLEDVPFFGAEAGVLDIKSDDCQYHSIMKAIDDEPTLQYIFGREYYTNGIMLIVFSGAELHVNAEYLLGWKPLGKEMTITHAIGSTCISEIDDIPAARIYEKYLNVKPDKFMLLNICEFPLLIERNGFTIARIPPIYDEEGRLYFGADVYQGEKLRLSYGNPQEILKETWDAGERMRLFEPEGIVMIICGSRTIFLKENADVEIEYFKRFHPQMVYCHGSSEIYRYQNQGGVLNSSIVAIGMREGDPPGNEITVEEKHMPTDDTPKIIPLADRMANFLEVTTNELKTTNYILKKVAVEAESANKAKSQFLSSVSHELRTPLNAILGMDEMILRDCKDETILEYAENIRNAGNNLLGLVNDILDFSKIEAGKMEIIPVEYALSSVLNDLVNMIQKRAEKKSLKLIVKAASDLPTILYGDEIRIKQVVTNILTNAVKYTEAGSVTMTVSFQKLEDNKISLRFEIKDTGIGIKPEDIKKLFNAFERIEEKRNRTIEGTGLGMNITQRLLHLMGSDLEVNSVYGEGSTFAFSIEQPVINWEPLGNFEENYHNMLSKRKAYHEKFTAPTAKILVVDDTQLNLAVVKGLLKQTQIQIETAESGYECLHLVTKNHYDVIFLDHRMPGIDGVETLQKMKTLHNNLNDETPVIALTANAVSGAREQYINAGFKNYVSKPIDSAALEAMLIKYLPPDKVHIADEEDKPVEESKLPDWLSTVKGLNTKEGVKHCGSVDAYLDTLKIFADAVKSGVNEIAGFYQKSDWKNYTTKVHALKSSARVIGADELSDRAKRLEDAGNSGYINEIKEGTSALLELYMSYESKLAPLIAKPVDTADKPLISDDDLSEAIEALKESAAAFDYDGVMFVLDELDGYRLPDDQIERFKAIRDAASKLDWEAIARGLSA